MCMVNAQTDAFFSDELRRLHLNQLHSCDVRAALTCHSILPQIVKCAAILLIQRCQFGHLLLQHLQLALLPFARLQRVQPIRLTL